MTKPEPIVLTPDQRALADGLARNYADAQREAQAARAMLTIAMRVERAAQAGLEAFVAVVSDDFTGRRTYDAKRGAIVARAE